MSTSNVTTTSGAASTPFFAAQQVIEIGSAESPVEGAGGGVVARLEGGEPFGEIVEVGEV